MPEDEIQTEQSQMFLGKDSVNLPKYSFQPESRVQLTKKNQTTKVGKKVNRFIYRERSGSGTGGSKDSRW